MATQSPNTEGIIAVIVECIQAAGGSVSSYEPNTNGIIAALTDLRIALQGGGTGTQSVAALAPGTSGEALTKGDAVYVKKSDGKFYKASNVFNREQAPGAWSCKKYSQRCRSWGHCCHSRPTRRPEWRQVLVSSITSTAMERTYDNSSDRWRNLFHVNRSGHL